MRAKKMQMQSMAIKKQLSLGCKEAIIHAANNGRLLKEIALEFGVATSTISRVLSRYREEGDINRKVGSGRPRKTTPRQDRAMIRQVKANPLRTAVEVTQYVNQHFGANVGVHTVRRRLVETDLHARRPAKKPLISPINRKKRLDFAKRHMHWSSEQWSRVLWSDESKFNLFSSDGVRYVRRPRGQKYNPRYHVSTVKHGGGSIMVWGSFSREGVGRLCQISGRMNAQMYREILKDHMLPHLRSNMPENSLFQHDNDPKHTSRLVRNFLEQENVNVLEWPPQSPDLNPIENFRNL